MTDQQAGDGQPPDAADDEFIARLRRIAARADPVPAALLSAARAAFSLRELDVRVAELVRDSAVDASATAVRGSGARLLSFEALSSQAGDAVIECEVTARGARRDLVGQLVGAVAAAVQVQLAGAEAVDAGVDEHGRFAVSGLPAGLLRLRCPLAGGSTLMTSWTAV
jgi:hypothetical protein